jgi:hypothetical protein
VVNVLELAIFLQAVGALHGSLQVRRTAKRPPRMAGERTAGKSDREHLTATAAAGGQHAAAIARGHAGAKTMDLGALALLGLVRTKQLKHPQWILKDCQVQV